MGRNPKPIALQIAEGDPRKHGVHKLDEKLAAQPEAKRGLPNCPKHLSGRARAAWKFWRRELEAMNLGRRPDAMMLEGACVNYSRAVQADILVEAGGVTVQEPVIDEGEQIGTKIRKNPAVEVSNAAWRNLRAFCSEFGLSPVSRTRLTVEKSDGADQDLMAILCAPRRPKI